MTENIVVTIDSVSVNSLPSTIGANNPHSVDLVDNDDAPPPNPNTPNATPASETQIRQQIIKNYKKSNEMPGFVRAFFCGVNLSSVLDQLAGFVDY